MDLQKDFLPEISPGDKIRVLMVINSQSISGISKFYLERQGLLLISCTDSGSKANDLIKKESFDLIMSDYDLSDMDAITFHMNLQNAGVKVPFLIFNVTDRDRAILEAYGSNPMSQQDDEHDVSIILNEQAQKIVQSVELYRTRNRLEAYTHHLEELVEERTRQLQIAQRFAVIGELATMIGHDMRNPLQVITNTYFLLMKKVSIMTPGEQAVLTKYGIHDLFSRINNETQYMNKIVSDLQDYAREVNLEKIDLNPGNLIERVLENLSIPDIITVEKRFEAGLIISVDPDLLARIMQNLILNALQAMEKGGVLSLSTIQTEGSICIFISDTGTGIQPGSENKIFEPLYTTKPKGAGLGLSVTKRLIEAQGGTIVLKETSRKGTTFMVTFPVS